MSDVDFWTDFVLGSDTINDKTGGTIVQGEKVPFGLRFLVGFPVCMRQILEDDICRGGRF